jgi:hypothetical protein
MVLRTASILTRAALDLAAQSSLAPTLEAALPGAWAGCWIAADPPAWDGGRWQPGLRAVALRLVNAGPADTFLSAATVEGGWLAAPILATPARLAGYGEPLGITLPLRPEGLEPGHLTGALHLEGPGWALTVPLQLFLPFGSWPWWDDVDVTLSTHVQEHTVRLATTQPHAGSARGEVFFQGAPVAVPAPEQRHPDGPWHWEIPLTAGEYSCTLLVDGKAVELEAREPHRWAWEQAGRGRLTVGAATATATVRNVGDHALDAYVEPDAPWLEAEPQRVRLEPGGAARLAIRDRLTRLENGAQTAHVRLLTAHDRRVWAELPVERRITADRSLPVVTPDELMLKAAGSKVEQGRLTIINVGGENITVRLEPPVGVVATPGNAQIAPGVAAVFQVSPGETPPGTGFLVIHTDSGYPAMRRLQVPITIRRLTVEAEPRVVDLGPVAPGGQRYQPLRLRRSDGAPGRFRVVVAPEAETWLTYRSDQLVARNRGPEYGPVAATVTATELVTGAHVQIPVKALLQRPRLKHSGPVAIEHARAGRHLTRVIRVWDEGEGLQIRDIRTLHHWLSARKVPEGVEVTVATGLRERSLAGEVQLYTNDPVLPILSIPVRVSVHLTWWERLRGRGLGWLLPVGAALILVSAGAAAWRWWPEHKPALNSGGGGGGSHGHVDPAR